MDIFDKLTSVNNKANADININANTNVNNDVNIDINTNVNTNANININDNVNAITIIKNVEEEKTKLYGYYMPVSMANKIELLAKKSNMSKSEFVRKLLSETLDKIKIEE